MSDRSGFVDYCLPVILYMQCSHCGATCLALTNIKTLWAFAPELLDQPISPDVSLDRRFHFNQSINVKMPLSLQAKGDLTTDFINIELKRWVHLTMVYIYKAYRPKGCSNKLVSKIIVNL